VAELVAGEHEIPESRSVAAALAVLAGIAASDAACCAALGRRSRGDDHRQAVPSQLAGLTPESHDAPVMHASSSSNRKALEIRAFP